MIASIVQRSFHSSEQNDNQHVSSCWTFRHVWVSESQDHSRLVLQTRFLKDQYSISTVFQSWTMLSSLIPYESTVLNLWWQLQGSQQLFMTVQSEINSRGFHRQPATMSSRSTNLSHTCSDRTLDIKSIWNFTILLLKMN